MRTARSPVWQHQLVLALLLAVKINQLTQRSSQGLRCDALRMINLDAPQMALLGDTIRLTCSFRLAGDETQNLRRKEGVSSTGTLNHDVPSGTKRSSLVDRSQTLRAAELVVDRPRQHSSLDDAVSEQPELLYAIKWYKDDREFYQFITRNWPHKHALPMAGLNIDMDKSDNQTVVLRNVSLKTNGLFRCEVSTDAPSFVTKSIERKIFIYSIPSEGPTIQTSFSASGLNRYNLRTGDQLELHCLSRDSKPNARLDWIINDRVNLTGTTASSANGTRVFDVKTRRFVRMPKLVTTSGKFQNETTYEVTETRGRTFLLPIGDADSISGTSATIDANTLDQFLEFSETVLNFTINTNLVQFLQINASNVAPISSHDQKVPTHKPIPDLGMKSARNNSSLGLPFKTRKQSGDPKRAGHGKQSDDGQRLPLDIRCVARVMHLSMSDEIRLRIVDRSTSASTIPLERHERMMHKNSAASLDNGQTLRYLFLCLLTWMIF